VVLEWLRAQKEIDPDKIALRGASLGSYLGTQVASTDDRLKGAALQAMAIEPTMHTAFETASPSFKLRFMYYTGIETEAELDKFLQSWTLKGVAEKVKCPYLLVGGEDDQLTPVEYGLQLMDMLTCPKQLLLYEGALHSVSGAPSTTNGPSTGTYVAEWYVDRFAGKPMQSKLMKVDAGGQVHDFKFEDSRKSLSVSLLWQGAEARNASPEKPQQMQEP
jgi:dienelactone hydrolase